MRQHALGKGNVFPVNLWKFLKEGNYMDTADLADTLSKTL